MVLAFFLKVVYLLVYCIYVLSDDIRDAHDHSEEDANANHFSFSGFGSSSSLKADIHNES
jgi:hypothetical protein